MARVTARRAILRPHCARCRRAGALVLSVGLLLGGCAVNPVTGERQLTFISESQEIAMGRQGAAGVEEQIGLVDDQALQQYVQRLGAEMAQASERPHLPWSFAVIDDPTPNAFAFPGGQIFFTRGLLALMRNEAELVSVLGHEIGHVTARHSVAMITRAQLAQIGLGVGAILSPTLAQFGELAGTGLSLLFLHYGRDAERQADDLGFRYALEQGYDVREMPNVFASLQRAGEAAGHSPLPAWLASHPYPEERITRIEGQLAALDRPLTGSRIGEEDFMRRIDGLMFGVNPRNGFFEARRFLHPELEFRIDFPEGWQTQNLPQAVMAGSAEQDAVLQLTLVPGALNEAANRFFNRDEVTASRVGPQTINGLSAVTGYFQAAAQGGTVGGLATFIRHGDRTYQLLGYTPADRLSQYDGAFRSTANSFQKLTDSAALRVQPNRIAVVQTREAMTLEAFNERHPSVVDVDALALINRLDGPSATIPAGFHMKRVVSE